MKRIIMNKLATALFAAIGALGLQDASAQLNPLVSQFYQNRYLGNPAFVGIDQGLNLNLSYRNQMSSIPGSPVSQAFTGDYQLGKAGVGLNVFNDKAGLIKRTRLVGSYAYHLPLGGNDQALAADDKAQQLHFGLSLGFLSERISNEDAVGDVADPAVGNFNQRETYIDGDFGVAYTGYNVTAQVAVPNIKGFLNRDDNQSANRSTFYTAVSYKVKLDQVMENLWVDPMFSFRGVKGFDSLWDLGTQASLKLDDNQFNLMGMYHSSQSFSVGAGANYRNKVALQAVYTTQTSALSAYSSGNFEVSLKVPLAL